MGGAQAKQRRSISRLHDDELSCVLPFLSLSELNRLVRCSKRFRTVVTSMRGLGFHLEGGATVLPPPSSVLSKHVASIRLRRLRTSDVLAQDILRRLKDYPHLTAMHLGATTNNDLDAAALIHGQSEGQVIEALKAVADATDVVQCAPVLHGTIPRARLGLLRRRRSDAAAD
jgi:hypothetical protein